MALLTWVCLVLSSASCLPPPPPGGGNDDMAVIDQLLFEEQAAELATLLELDETQVALLKRVRTAADELDRQYEPAILEARAALDEKAATVRQNMEAGASLSDADKQALRELRHRYDEAHHRLHRAKRAEFRQLRTILNEDQQSKANDFLERHELGRRRPPRRPRGPGFGPLGRRGGPPRKHPGRTVRVHRELVRIMLSDAFLKRYP